MNTFLRPCKRLIKHALEVISAIRPRHLDALLVSARGRSRGIRSDEANLKAAVEWLKGAQDVTGCGGISWGYRARAAVRSGEPLGWQPAYPETSGYILESFIRYGQLHQDQDCIDRARRIADWELCVQLADGGIPGGMSGATLVESSTFVTGQVLFGFVRAYQEFASEAYAQAARRATAFLLSCLDENGRFIKGYSHFCASGPKAYEVRTGWALALYGTALGDAEAVAAARRMADFTLRCQQPNGWFCENDLNHHDRPLTHTIGYTLEGLFELGELLKEASYVAAVHRTLSSLKRLATEEGFLAGRWTADWRPAVSWCCLTGSCQIARVCFRMSRHYPNDGFHELGTRLLNFVAGTQYLRGRNPGLVGAIFGSYPFGGDYGPYAALNWAAKFFVDAMMESTTAT